MPPATPWSSIRRMPLITVCAPWARTRASSLRLSTSSHISRCASISLRIVIVLFADHGVRIGMEDLEPRTSRRQVRHRCPFLRLSLAFIKTTFVTVTTLGNMSRYPSPTQSLMLLSTTTALRLQPGRTYKAISADQIPAISLSDAIATAEQLLDGTHTDTPQSLSSLFDLTAPLLSLASYKSEVRLREHRTRPLWTRPPARCTL